MSQQPAARVIDVVANMDQGIIEEILNSNVRLFVLRGDKPLGVRRICHHVIRKGRHYFAIINDSGRFRRIPVDKIVEVHLAG